MQTLRPTRRSFPTFLGLFAISLALIPGCAEEEPYARAFEITRLDQTIGGPKSLARPADPSTDRPGDLMLENDRIRVTILGAHPSMGPSVFGGSLADADIQWNDPRFSGGKGKDQLAEVFANANMNVLAPLEDDDVFILADGSDGGPAVIRVVSLSEPFLTLLKPLWGLSNQPEFHLITDYSLSPGESWVRMDSTVVLGWDGEGELPAAEAMLPIEPNFPLIETAVENGIVGGDFYLQGGSVNVFGPGMGFDESGFVAEQRELDRNLFLDPAGFEFLAGVGDGVSYGIAGAVGDVYVPLFTASQTATFYEFSPTRSGQKSLSYSRYFFVGTGDVGSILDGIIRVKEIPHGTLHGVVLEEGTSSPRSGYDVFAYRPGDDGPYSQWRTDVDPRDDVADGSFGGTLPVGDWELMVHQQGRPDSERLAVTVAEGSDQDVVLISPRPGLFSFTIRDERGLPVPAKVTLFAVDDDVSRDPTLGDSFIGGNPEAVLFPMYGSGEAELPDGEYYAVASRGLEYELDISEPFLIDATRRTHLNFTVIRSVQTDGWVSADLHVHAVRSHDSGVALADRVRTMVCEGVEFFAATDHDWITDYAPTIEMLEMGEWVQSAPGNEVTTIETGHFLGFPLAEDFLGDAGGAVDWTGLTPEEMIEQLREIGEEAGLDPVVFIGHPRAGILGYFDQYGLDPYSGTIENVVSRPSILTASNPLISPDELSMEFDAIELMGTKDLIFLRTPTQPELDQQRTRGDLEIIDVMTRTLEEQQGLRDGEFRLGYGIEGQIDDWFTLLNLGYRYTALGNSDTHGVTSTEAGCPRNFILSETDDPAFIDDQAMADAVKEHRVIASYGPYLQMWINGEMVGSEVVDEDGVIDITIEVQAPTWMDVDRVELYQNGTLVEVLIADNPDEVIRLSTTLERSIDQDSWYVAIATGDDSMSPVFTPVEIPYIPLDEIVIEALGGVGSVATFLSPSIPMPLTYPIHPYALTNPIWVDVDGDGFDAPGLPDWLLAPEEPVEEETGDE
jgi:hypothetical protein